MAINAQMTVLWGRTSSPSVFSRPKEQSNFLSNHQLQDRASAGKLVENLSHIPSQEFRTLDINAWGILTSRQSLNALGRGLAARRIESPKKSSYRRQRIRCCSSAEPRDLPPHDAALRKSNNKSSTLELLKTLLLKANSIIAQAVVASTALAFLYPPSFTWFTTGYYAPALGFLMFAVGINLNVKAFQHAIERPAVIAAGYGGQFFVKPILGLLAAYSVVSLLNLPTAIGSGLILVSCVSGAQLSNYATFIFDPSMTPLSIVMTALSTITAVVVTPALSLLMLRKRLPVNVVGMMSSITQIVVVPIAAGLALNKFLPTVSNRIRVFLPLSSVLVTCCCIGAPLALNVNALKSKFGLKLLLPITIFHALAFVSGYKMTKVLFSSEPDTEQLAKTISLETGMQSSLLAFTLAKTFYEDPLVGLPAAISTVVMTLMGMGLGIFWHKHQGPAP